MRRDQLDFISLSHDQDATIPLADDIADHKMQAMPLQQAVRPFNQAEGVVLQLECDEKSLRTPGLPRCANDVRHGVELQGLLALIKDSGKGA
eukprot:evm.model.NODE_4483_length_7135_cov_24.159496.3